MHFRKDSKSVKSSRKRAQIVIADDDPLVLHELVNLLAADFDVVGRALDGRDLAERVKQLSPDVVVTDISMPVMDGISATKQITKAHPAVKVVIVSAHGLDSLVSGARAAGASGYVIKMNAVSELVDAVQAVLSGQEYWPLVDRRISLKAVRAAK